MTIEEKAKEIIRDAFDEDEILPARLGFIVKQQRLAFRQGAEWMIEKAVDWIGDNVVADKFGRPIDTENFRKAMEE